MHVRPVGQCAVRVPDEGQTESLDDEELARLVPEQELADGAPVVALFDGMPLTGHRLLNSRVIVDDPDGYEAAYQAHERMHGTGMASLICHGDLDQSSAAAETAVVCAADPATSERLWWTILGELFRQMCCR